VEFRINGFWSLRSNQLTSLSNEASWIKTPWIKPGSGNITLKTRLENDGGTTRTITFSYISYDATQNNVIKEGPSTVFYTYNFPKPFDIWIKDLSIPLPAAIANANQAYKILITCVGSGGTSRIFLDDIVIPGDYWSNPSDNCLPLAIIIDSDKDGMLEMYEKDYIKGLTTNPTLMKKAGITDYCAFAKDILATIKDKSISFEVFSDDFEEMERQALEIASWGENVYVKIPITNTKQEVCYPLIKRLSDKGVKLNVTAMMTLDQVQNVVKSLNPDVPSYVSVFAGRIADTGYDPLPLMKEAVNILKSNPKAELIWASPRELLNIFQADEIGCQIITVTNDILKKLSLVGYNLDQYSLDTVKMFYNDAQSAGFNI
jgi:transaldolase